MKLVQSFLGFKQKKSVILQQRNSLLKLILILNLPNLIIIYLFYRFIDSPYMDQMFHYFQYKNYSLGNYHIWDNKITTPPGLYHLQTYFIQKIFGNSLTGMRMGNALIFGNIFAVYALKIFQFQDHNRNNISRTLNLILTPTIYFFFFLDYTDTASIAFLTMSLYYTLVGSTWRTGICSLMSVYIRQNNIIWAAYLLFYRIIIQHKTHIESLRGNLVVQILLFIKFCLINLKILISQNLGQLCVFPIFAYYLHYYNDDKLLFGDHQSHQMVFHPAQILYLCVFIVINMPLSIGDFAHVLKQSINRIYYSRHAFAAYLFALSACIIIVDQFTFVHKFILSDNRHYIFYLYRYFRWGKYPFCALYAFCIIFIARVLLSTKINIAKLCLWTATSMLYLGLSELVEFRYFAAPFVILMFQVKSRNLSIDVQKIHEKSLVQKKLSWPDRMIWGTIFKIVVNSFIFYVFIFRPFGKSMNDRFIW